MFGKMKIKTIFALLINKQKTKTMKKVSVLLMFICLFVTTFATPRIKVYRGHCKGISKQMMLSKHKSFVKYRRR